MFRTLSRLGLPLLLCVLVLAGYGLQLFYNDVVASFSSRPDEVATFASRSGRRALKGATVEEAGQGPAATVAARVPVAAKRASPSGEARPTGLRRSASPRREGRYCRGRFYCLLIAVYCLLTLFEFYFPPKIKKVPPRGSTEYEQLLEEHVEGNNTDKTDYDR